MPCIKIWLEKKPIYHTPKTESNSHPQTPINNSSGDKTHHFYLLVSGRKDWREVTPLSNLKLAWALYCEDDFEWATKVQGSHSAEGWVWQECGREWGRECGRNVAGVWEREWQESVRECGRDCGRQCDTSLPTCGHTLQPAAPLLTHQVSRPGLLCAQHVFAISN